nr:hypothetical protein C2845_PM04G30420 [Ipomoea batatas]
MLHPPGTLRGPGHWATISAVHEIAWHLSAPGLVGAKLMGILKPSTLEMSKKSRLLNWFRANSARVFGGLPHPVNCNTPPQSPVSHEPLPLPSKLQFLRPHIRAMAVPGGTLMFQLWPRSSRRPPPTGVAAAHTHTSIEPVELTGQRRGTQLQNQRWVAPASNNERRNWVAPAKAVDTDSNSGLNRNPNIDTDGGNQARKGKELKPVCAPDSNPITMLVTVCVEQKK